MVDEKCTAFFMNVALRTISAGSNYTAFNRFAEEGGDDR
jgi:hypothetical protein